MPRAVIDVDMTASASIPGTRKSTGCRVPVGSTCTPEKNNRNTTGMPRVRKTVSPLVAIMVTSARSWATRGLTGRAGRWTCPAPGGHPVPVSAPVSAPGPGSGSRFRSPVSATDRVERERDSSCRIGQGVPARTGDGQVGLLQGMAGAQITDGQVVGGQPSGQSGDGRRRGDPGGGDQPIGAGSLLGDRGPGPEGPHQGRAEGTGVDAGGRGEADGAVGGSRGQVGRAPLGQLLPPVDDDHLVGQTLGLVELVGGQHHADAAGALVGDDVAHHDASFGVDAGGGLVEEEHLGLPHQRQRQRESLLLPAGQSPPRRAPDRSQPHPLDELVGVLGVVVVGGEEVEYLGRAEHGVDAAPLQHDPDAAHQLGVVAAWVEAEHPGGAPVERAVALQGLDGAGLAGAVGTEQRHHLAGVGHEREVVDGQGVAVTNDDPAAVDGRRSEHGAVFQVRPSTVPSSTGGHATVVPQ